jgi:chemotaxis protein MotB
LPLAYAPAQEAKPTAEQNPQSVEDVQALVDKIKRQLEEMDAATRKRDEGLQFLQDQIDQATGRLEGSDATNEALRAKVGELGTTVEDLTEQQRSLDQNLQEATKEKETLEQQLARKIAELEAMLTAERTTSAAALAQERQVSQQTAVRAAMLERDLEAERARADTALAEKEASVTETSAALQAAQARIRELEGLLDTARGSLLAMQSTLNQTQTRVGQQQATIEDLGQRLNEALARKVEELSRYRSEFFGTLSASLGERPDIRVVGDRFVLQSELLFDPGSAEIGPEGRAELAKVAQTLQQIAQTIPPNIPWVLRVDGHTDRQPIRSGRFASNWDLSTARAVAVVQYLISRGLPPDRLAAAGFGEYKPLDPRDDEIAYRRNRRIEFKLTES